MLFEVAPAVTSILLLPLGQYPYPVHGRTASTRTKELPA